MDVSCKQRESFIQKTKQMIFIYSIRKLQPKFLGNMMRKVGLEILQLTYDIEGNLTNALA